MPAKKADRITGWQLMRRLLAEAGMPEGVIALEGLGMTN